MLSFLHKGLAEKVFYGIAYRPTARRRLKKLLRLRAARNGRSMEDEVRTILRDAADEAGHEVLEDFTPPRAAGARRRSRRPARDSACC